MIGNPLLKFCDKWTLDRRRAKSPHKCTRADGWENSHYGYREVQGGQINPSRNGQHNSSNLLSQHGGNR